VNTGMLALVDDQAQAIHAGGTVTPAAIQLID
jgi:hypothetical protein